MVVRWGLGYRMQLAHGYVGSLSSDRNSSTAQDSGGTVVYLGCMAKLSITLPCMSCYVTTAKRIFAVMDWL